MPAIDDSPITRPPSPMLPLPTRPSVSRNGASRLTARTASQRASSMLASSLSRVMPALLTRMSALPPWWSRRCSLILSTASSAVTSSHSAVPPTLLAVSARFSAADSTSMATTWAPSRANTSAMVAPMPRAAPVTMATLPSSGFSQSAGGVESSAPTEKTWPST
ncbi:Uncharacterised protein [Mycobacterium tuberculosis]|uniref:Uncharacterized protein n=1 Tax=Mycobacterium tuberculosis TaxID=1773 RepID=A0A655EU45_MYCTX|nr:Uncharacterised protein [Mycobacterium tuberculosis]CNV32688.1 Uncharacterised protein [Mycobacterium tuberculosis]CNV91888.1 Uncharacterised protein [Mycobacterium tuberculosis]